MEGSELDIYKVRGLSKIYFTEDRNALKRREFYALSDVEFTVRTQELYNGRIRQRENNTA